MEEPTTEEFKFLSDRPISKNEKGYFNFFHNSLAPAIKKILENSSCVHTIGLFGRWGTGKSTIIKLLKEGQEIKDTKIVEFDCWKYQNDSLRRQILYKLAVDLGLGSKKIKELEKDFYFTVNEKLSEKIDFSWRALGINAVRFFIYLISSVFLVFLLLELLGKFSLNILFYIALPLWPVISLIFDKIIPSFKPGWQNVMMINPVIGTKSKLESPELFEQKFKEILNDSKYQKIVIVIDNLDRVETTLALEMLSTLKTFLEIKDSSFAKQVIFVVPCDYYAIKQPFLEKDADEYLKKIFNLIIWLPEFISADLEGFIRQQVKETGGLSDLLNNDDLILVINSAFSNTPRDIKQFINNLVSMIVVARETEVKDVIENNIPYLAKILVLMQKYPEKFIKLKDVWYSPEKIMSGEDDRDFYEFMQNTNRITVDNAEPFIYFKKPHVFSGLAEQEKMLDALINENETDFNDLLKNTKNNKLVVDYILYLFKKYKQQREILFKIFKTQLSVFNKNNISIDKKDYFYQTIDILDAYLWQFFEYLPITTIFKFIITNSVFDNSREYTDKIIGRLVVAIDSDDKIRLPDKREFLKEIFVNILDSSNLLGDNHISKISSSLEKYFSTELDIIILFKKENWQKSFITLKTFDSFVKIATIANFDTWSNVLSLFKKYIDNNKLHETVFTKVNQIITELNSSAEYEKKIFLIKKIRTIFVDFKKELNNLSENVKRDIGQSLIQFYNNISNFEDREVIINLLIFTRHIMNDDQKNNITNLLSQYYQNVSASGLSIMMDFWAEETRSSLISNHLNVFISRSVKDYEFLGLVYNYANEEDKKSILKNLIEQNENFALQFLEKTKRWPDRQEIFSNLLRKCEQLPIQNRHQIYHFIKGRVNLNDQKEIKEIIAQHIKMLLKTDDPLSQEQGYNLIDGSTFISKDSLREIAKEVLGFLRQPGKILNYNFQFALRVIYIYRIWNYKIHSKKILLLLFLR